MISVSEELKNAFNTGNQKDLTLYFSDNTLLTNENIVAESMSLEQILCDEEQINFGLCNAASFKITILNSNTSRVGQTVTPVITIRGTEYSMQLGVFKIVEDRVTDDRLHRNITAYDALYDIVNTDYASWYSSLTFPMTLKQFRDAFFTHIGLTQVSASLINDSITVEKTVDADVFSGSDIIKAICELNAVFGCIDNEGNFKYIPFVHEGGLYPEEDLFPADDLYPNDGFDVIVSGSPYSYVSGSFVYEDYVVQRITGLAIVEDESDTSELYGTDDNVYMITGNYLLFGKNATDLRTVAENFLGFVGRFQYKPARIRMRAMPWVELGDIIGVVGKKGNAVFPILKRTMSGITALYDDYEAQGKEYYSFSANTVSSMVEKLKSKTMRIVANVDEISTELTEYETQTDGTLNQHSSRIQQNAENISSEVARATGSENSLSSMIIQTAESIESEVERATGAESSLSSRITQTAHKITLSISGSIGKEGSGSASITVGYLDENENPITDEHGQPITTVLPNVHIDGDTIFTSQLTDGQTIISGNNIQTGTLSANRVRSGALISNNGTMSIDLDNNTITANTLVVNSSNFTLDANGNLDCENATLTNAYMVSAYIPGYLYVEDMSTITLVKNRGVYNDVVTFSITDNTSYMTIKARVVFKHQIWSNSSITIGGDGLCLTGIRTPQSSHTANMYWNPDNGYIYKSTTGSSKRYKHDITTELDEKLNPHNLYNLDVVQFKYNKDFIDDGEKLHIGFIAEDVDKVYPVATEYSEPDENGNATVENWFPREIIPAMLKLIQEQHKEIKEQQEKINKLEERLAKIEELLA